jgi:hypothetical protein
MFFLGADYYSIINMIQKATLISLLKEQSLKAQGKAP